MPPWRLTASNAQTWRLRVSDDFLPPHMLSSDSSLPIANPATLSLVSPPIDCSPFDTGLSLSLFRYLLWLGACLCLLAQSIFLLPSYPRAIIPFHAALQLPHHAPQQLRQWWRAWSSAVTASTAVAQLLGPSAGEPHPLVHHRCVP